MISQLFIIASLFVIGFSFTVDDCPSHLDRSKFLKVYGKKCYRFFVNEKREFEDAEDYCRYLEGELVLVKTKAISRFIHNALKSYRHPNAKVWIGMRWDYDENDFQWEDGTDLVYDNFGDNSWSQRDCVYMNGKSELWYAHDCTSGRQGRSKHNFICEYPVAAPTVTASPPEEPKDCPGTLAGDESLKIFHKKCYKFVLKSGNFKHFQDAQRDCKKDGGNLAMIKSRQVNNFIEKQLDDSTYQTAWIGIRYYEHANDYKWADGTTYNFNFENFGGEEAGIGEDCVSMDSDGFWYESDCDDQHLYDDTRKPYICEYELSPRRQSTPRLSTSPSTMAPKTTPLHSTADVATSHSHETTTAMPTTDSKTSSLIRSTTESWNTNATTTTKSVENATYARWSTSVTTPMPEEITISTTDASDIAFTTSKQSANSTNTWNVNPTTTNSLESTTFAWNNKNTTTDTENSGSGSTTPNPTDTPLITIIENTSNSTPYPDEITTAHHNTTSMTSKPDEEITTTPDVMTSFEPDRSTTSAHNTAKPTTTAPEITTTATMDKSTDDIEEITTTPETRTSVKTRSTIMTAHTTTTEETKMVDTVNTTPAPLPNATWNTTVYMAGDTIDASTSPSPPQPVSQPSSTKSATKYNNRNTTLATAKTTCAVIQCELDCGLDGYVTDTKTGCVECKCDA